MTRLNLSELAKQRLEKSHLRYEYQPYSDTGRIVSTYPDYKGDEYTVCMHGGLNDDRYDSNILKSKIENEFPQFISSVNVYRNINGNEKFKNFGSSYNAYSRKLDYKDEKYKIISCDKKGKVDGYDLYLQDEDSEFYNYVEDLQTIKSDSRYKNFNFEFNAERAAKVRELTKPSNAVVEDEDDVDLSIKQACFENIIRKMTEQNKGMER